MQIYTAFIGKIKVNNNVDGLNIDTSGYQIRADQSFELTFSEPIENFNSLVRFHVRMQIFILIFFLV